MAMTDEEWASKVHEILRNDGVGEDDIVTITFLASNISFFLMLNSWLQRTTRKNIVRALESVAFMIRLHELEEERENDVDPNRKNVN